MLLELPAPWASGSSPLYDSFAQTYAFQSEASISLDSEVQPRSGKDKATCSSFSITVGAEMPMVLLSMGTVRLRLHFSDAADCICNGSPNGGCS